MKTIAKIVGWLLIVMQIMSLAGGGAPSFRGNLLMILAELLGFFSFGIIGVILLILGHRERENKKGEEKGSEAEKKDDRSEIVYFDKDGRITTKDKAVRAVIREYDEKGNLIREVFGSVSH